MNNSKNNNNELCINPVKKYNSPNYPSLANIYGNPALLKKLPNRWQRNAKVIAYIGLIGTLALAGCSQNGSGSYNGGRNGYYREHSEPYIRANGEYDVMLSLHHGGSGFGPFYVVRLTEQEVMSIIRSQLEAAGLRLNSKPPIDSITAWGDIENPANPVIELNLFDETKGIIAVSIDGINRPWYADVNEMRQNIAARISRQTDGITAGVFYSTGVSLGMAESWWGWGEIEGYEEYAPPTAEEKTKAGIEIAERLIEQLQKFIEWLQEQGIL